MAHRQSPARAGNLTTTGVALTPESIELLDTIGRHENRTRSFLVRTAVEQWLRRHGARVARRSA